MPKHITKTLIIDDLTYRKDISRQRKYQLRKRKQGNCERCGILVEKKNRVRGNQIIAEFPELCPKCRAKSTANKRGELQGRERRDWDDTVPADLEGIVD